MLDIDRQNHVRRLAARAVIILESMGEDLPKLDENNFWVIVESPPDPSGLGSNVIDWLDNKERPGRVVWPHMTWHVFDGWVVRWQCNEKGGCDGQRPLAG